MQLRTIAILLCVLALTSCGRSSAQAAQPLEASPETPAWAAGLVSAQQTAAAQNAGLPVARELELGGGGGTIRFVLVPPGRFMMGTSYDSKNRDDTECPQHLVRLTQPFYMAVTEVTQRQYEAVMGKNPSEFKGAENPVDGVSWYDAQEFCERLNRSAFAPPQNLLVALPTEAQREYACRAGTTTQFSFGDNPARLGDYAWHAGNSGRTTHPASLKKPNGWGLYGMHGNIAEWCQDWYGDYTAQVVSDPTGPPSGSYRVLRGGHWGMSAAACRSAQRGGEAPDRPCGITGFRVVLLPGDSSD